MTGDILKTDILYSQKFVKTFRSGTTVQDFL